MSSQFGGVLFVIGKPSQAAPWKGPVSASSSLTSSLTKGKQILVSRSVIPKALKELVGKPLWLHDESISRTGHSRHLILGTITKTGIYGDLFFIGGELNHSVNDSETLGLSYDILNARLFNEEPPILCLVDGEFIGASVLPQRIAAHRTDCLFWVE